MLKKIIILGIIGAIILVGVAFSFPSSTVEENVEEKVDEQTMTITGDIVMPSKVSRPGCEEIDRCYIPSNIVIEKGKQVTWVNEDSAFHSVTSGLYETPTELFDSGHLDPYETYTLTFDESGTFDYFCTLHPWMKGQVIVE